MDQHQQLRRKLQDRKRQLAMQDTTGQPARAPRSPSPNERRPLQRPVSPPEPRPASPLEPPRSIATVSVRNQADPVKGQGLVSVKRLPTDSRGSLDMSGRPRALTGGAFGGSGSDSDATQVSLSPEHISSNRPSAALAATGRSIESVGKAAEAAVLVMASTAGSAAAAAVDTASSAASAAVAVAASAASAAASATGCLPRTESTMTRTDLLGEVPLFSGISRAQMDRVAETMEVLDATTGQVIVRQGDRGANEMYVVESGHLHVTVTTPEGVELGVVKEYFSGNFFGELAILAEEDIPRSATVTAVEPSRLLSLRRHVVAELLRHQGLYYTLGQVQLFAGLGISKLHQIGNSMSRRKVAIDEVVIQQGDAGNEMFVVESGRLEASVILPDGKDIGVVKTYTRGEYFGELALMSDAPRSATVTARDECTLLVLERQVVNELLASTNLSHLAEDRKNAYKVSEAIVSEEEREYFCCNAPGVVIHPYHPFCRSKDFLMTVFILYSASWEPYKAAFANDDDVQETVFDIFVDCVYWADLALSFVTGYELLTHVELRLKKIVRNYLSGWFIIDFVATFNWSWFFGLFMTDEEQAGGQLAMIRLLRLIRILRILKMGRIVERLSEYLSVRSAFIKIVQLVLGLLLIIHLIACFFYLVPSLEKLDHESEEHRGRLWAALYANKTIDECYAGPDPRSSISSQTAEHVEGPMHNSWVCDMGVSPSSDSDNAIRYMTAAYWSITTVSTIGYGDISPNLNSKMELVFSIVVEFIGMFIFSYVVSNMANLVSNLNVKSKEFQSELDRFVEYMRDKNTPEALSRRVIAYLNFRAASKFALTDEDYKLLNQLNPALRMEMQISFYTTALLQIPILQEKEPGIITWRTRLVEELALCIETTVAMPGDLIQHRGEMGKDHMYIVLSGAVYVYGNSHKRKQTIAADNQYPFFGVAEMFDEGHEFRLYHRSVRAKGSAGSPPTDLGRVTKAAFRAATEHLSEAWDAFKAIGDAEMHGMLNLDFPVNRKKLEENFNSVASRYFDECEQGDSSPQSMSPKSRAVGARITTEQLRELVSELGAELVEPMLSRAVRAHLGLRELCLDGLCTRSALATCAVHSKDSSCFLWPFVLLCVCLLPLSQMEMMEAELTPVTTMTRSWDGTVKSSSSSALTVDFDHFYRYWTNANGNFTDPKGFCDLATVRPIWQCPAARKSVDCLEDMLGNGHIRKGTAHGDTSNVAMAEVGAHIESIDQRIDNVEHTLGVVQKSVTSYSRSFVSVEKRIEALEAHVDNRLQRIEQLLIRSMALSNDLGAQ